MGETLNNLTRKKKRLKEKKNYGSSQIGMRQKETMGARVPRAKAGSNLSQGGCLTHSAD